jgi:hypothetical protein
MGPAAYQTCNVSHFTDGTGASTPPLLSASKGNYIPSSVAYAMWLRGCREKTSKMKSERCSSYGLRATDDEGDDRNLLNVIHFLPAEYLGFCMG